MRKTKLLLVVALFCFALGSVASVFGADIICYFPPDWKADAIKAKAITDALSAKAGVSIKPRIASTYPEIIKAFDLKQEMLVYVGSFVQSILYSKGESVPLLQGVNGKEMYGSWMVLPKEADPEKILKTQPENIAFAKGSSSGESGAKAATAGAARVATGNHGATANAVKEGKAAAGFVKSWWWKANEEKYPTLKAYEVPGISDEKNCDNVLTASKSIPADIREKIKKAAISSKDVFGVTEIAEFDTDKLDFSIALMKKGKIDPQNYAW